MKKTTTYQRLLILFSLLSLITAVTPLLSCSELPIRDADVDVYESESGEDIIDSFVFLGESTTTHLKSRGVLSGGKNTNKVLSTASGTLCLDASIASVKFDVDGRDMTISEYAAEKRPRRIMLCFGLNGAKRNAAGNGTYFKSCYGKLVTLIRDSSPDTEIYIQSCYPIAENMDTAPYGCTPSELNTMIDRINSYAREFADENGIVFVDTASLLKNEKGMLSCGYQSGDGYHLTTDAYVKILEYIENLGREGKL